MAKCLKCGRRGIFLRLTAFGLCKECELLQQEAENKELELRKVEVEKKNQELAEAIARDKAEKKQKILLEAISKTKFSRWDIQSHALRGRKRIDKSTYMKIISYDDTTGLAEILNHPYDSIVTTSLNACTCYDFNDEFLPCKHIYHMAFKYGGINRELLLDVCGLNVESPHIEHDYYASEFAIDHERKLAKWEARIETPIEKMRLARQPQNPDIVVAAYKKSIDLFDDLEQWCMAQDNGYRWFLFDGIKMRTRIEDEFEDFLIDDYDGLNESFLEEKQRIRYDKKLNADVLSFIKKNPNSQRKDIYSAFPNDDNSKLLKILNEQVKAEKITTAKISGVIHYSFYSKK